MSSFFDFPESNHIERLREHLWSGQNKEFGEAAVMVGSGFSKNARKVSPSVNDVPDWNQLGKKIMERLNSDQSEKSEFNRKLTGDEILKKASEYEAVYGRQSLNELIMDSISDKKYSPGEMHKLLLSIPWADVFTTNYDTLLERTLPNIYKRNYDVVKNSAAIPRSTKPRIFKLHGSIPDQTPFIITEEDYRTYPRKYAPFVNAVQQSLMENLFCLIGFSGSDPNFLYWAGWVRDNLGSDMKRIYLCGMFNSLRESRRELFKRRNIIPIDLSFLFELNGWPSKYKSYQKALKWFLGYLVNGQPPEPLDWPGASQKGIKNWDEEDLPVGPFQSSSFSDMTDIQPNSQGKLNQNELSDLLKRWKAKREEYPKWVVAPNKSRHKLWRRTEQWVEKIFNSIDSLSPPEDLFLLYELNWRLETTLTPLLSGWAESIESVLETYNPFPGEIVMSNAKISPDNEEENKWDRNDWSEVQNKWVELALALLRYHRERHNEKSHRSWAKRMRDTVKAKARWESRWYYEKSLFHLFRFETEDLRKTLSEWPEFEDYPLGELKRASLFAETGQINKAEGIARDALENVRTRMEPSSPDYSLLSLEGWIMLLLNSINWSKIPDDKINVENFQSRWRTLQQFGCDPNSYRKTLKSKVESPPPPFKIPELIITRSFKPDRKTITQSMSNSHPISDFRPAFSFIRMYEEGGLPIRSGVFVSNREAVLSSAKWINSFSFDWALSLMVRVGSKNKKLKKKVDNWVSRVKIASLDAKEVEYLAERCFNCIKQSMESIKANPSKTNTLSRNILKPTSRLLWKLSFRLGGEEKKKMSSLALRAYTFPGFMKDHSLHAVVELLFQNLLEEALSVAEIEDILYKLISLPVPGIDNFKVSASDSWPEPVSFLYNRLKDFPSNPVIRSSKWKSQVSRLIKIVEEAGSDPRERAIIRLGFLFELGVLTETEEVSFGEALWDKIGEETGLPTSFPEWLGYSFLLNLPDPEGQAKKKLKSYLLSGPIPRQHSRYTVNWNSRINDLIKSTPSLYPGRQQHEDRYLDWSSNEASKLLKKTFNWWEDEKGHLRKRRGASKYFLKKHLEGVINLLYEVILPRLPEEASDELKSMVSDLISGLSTEGFYVLSLLPATLYLNINTKEDILEEIRNGLNAQKKDRIRSAAQGIINWLYYSQEEEELIISPPEVLIEELVDRVVMRRQPGLRFAISTTSSIIETFSESISQESIERLCASLQYFKQETEIVEKRIEKNQKESTSIIPIEERPEYRRAVAKLAHNLQNYLLERDQQIPEQLKQWKEIALDSKLPEVRRIWK